MYVECKDRAFLRVDTVERYESDLRSCWLRRVVYYQYTEVDENEAPLSFHPLKKKRR